jgi:hypothetical protein
MMVFMISLLLCSHGAVESHDACIGICVWKRVARVRVTNSDGRQRSREVTGARLDRNRPDLGQQVQIKKLSANAAALAVGSGGISTVHKAPAPRWRPGACLQC